MVDQIVQTLNTVAPAWHITDQQDTSVTFQRGLTFDSFNDALAFAPRLQQVDDDILGEPQLIIAGSDASITLTLRLPETVTSDDLTVLATIDDLYTTRDLEGGQETKVEAASRESFPASDPPSY